MNWYMPTQTKWLAGAAIAVFCVGLLYLNMDHLPRLTAGNQASAVRLAADTDMRDAVASPAAGMGWFQPSAGAAYMSRAAHNPALLNRLKNAPTAVPAASGRNAFNAPRAIVDDIHATRSN